MKTEEEEGETVESSSIADMMARVGTTSIDGFELYRSGEFIGLEYMKEIFSVSDAEHEEDQANLTKKKKALVSFPSPIRFEREELVLQSFNISTKNQQKLPEIWGRSKFFV